MKNKKETLMKLLDREITPNQCMEELGLSSGRELEELINLSDIPKRKRKSLTIQDANDMNFLEIRSYCKDKVNKGANITDLMMEIEIKWEEGVISGFDYRYFKESVGLRINKEFIRRAKSIGRYEK